MIYLNDDIEGFDLEAALQQISELRLTKGMGLVRYEAKRILCEKIAAGEPWEKIAEAVNALYESHREYGETEYQLSWQFDREKEFDLELYKKIPLGSTSSVCANSATVWPVTP